MSNHHEIFLFDLPYLLFFSPRVPFSADRRFSALPEFGSALLRSCVFLLEERVKIRVKSFYGLWTRIL